MSFSAEDFGKLLRKELDKGYDPIKISEISNQIYLDHGNELDKKLDKIVLELMTMSEGPEFELSKNEIWNIVRDLGAPT